MTAQTEAPPNPVRILLVEDQTIMRDVLSEWIGGIEGWRLVGACSTLAEARARLSRGDIDVVVLDVQLPDGSGLDLTDGMESGPLPRIVLVTAHEQPWLLREASRAPVLGIVMKGAPLSDLRRAIERAAAGEPSYCRRTSELMRTWTMRSSPHEQLTPRELEILRHVVRGKTSREIASLLDIREKTVQNHRANLMEKLDIHDVAGLVRYAMAHGLVPAEG